IKFIPMKMYSFVTAITVMIVFISCTKDHDEKTCEPVLRKVRYELYAADNFAGQKTNITFRIIMRNDRTHKIYIDSSLATMKVEEIPDFQHRIIIEKLVPGNDTATLTVGFINYLEGSSIAWRLEEFEKGDNFIVTKWPFL
ncbi:MAG: hypothetical protein ABIR18_13030, partial [Chitinophagaceae bacterium]